MPISVAFDIVGSGPPVVILHGLFGCGRNWVHIARALGETHRVYLPDARNHGASSRSPTMSYSAMAEDVLTLIEGEQLRRPIVIGHGMGGKTAMTLALDHPQAIAGVAVIDAAPGSDADRLSPYVTAMRGREMAAATDRDEVRQAFAQYMGHEAPVDLVVQNLQRHREHLDWRLNLLAVAGCMHELYGFTRRAGCERYEGPALFLTGAKSDAVQPAMHADIKRLFPRARLERIADAGHWVHTDRPDALLNAFQEWLPEAAARPMPSAARRIRALN